MAISRGGSERTVDRTSVKALRACGDQAAEAFSEAYEILLKRLDGVLFRKAGKAETPVLQQLYLDSSQALWTSRRVMMREFEAALKHNFRQSLRREISPELDFNREREHDYELSLLENSNLDDYLVLTQMATDMTRVSRAEINGIELKVSALLQDPELQQYHSPFTPMAVSYAIGHACTKANFSARTKELVMELCAKHLAEVFLVPFERLLDLLSDPHQIVAALNRGKAQPRQVVEAQSAVVDAKQTRSDLIDFLQKLQAELRSPQTPGVRSQARSVRDLLEVSELGEISQQDLVSIDMVAAIFDHIVENRRIPSRFKVLLGRLQFPLLKAALLDVQFLSGGTHPARQLLARAALTAQKWGDDQTLYDLLSTMVQRVLNEFEQDTAVFSGLLVGVDEGLKPSRSRAAQSHLAESKARVLAMQDQAARAVAERCARLGYRESFRAGLPADRLAALPHHDRHSIWAEQ